MLILDEPTDGLDPNQKHEVRTLIRKMGQTKAIIFSTHILEEVEAACSRAIIIDRGQIVANGTPDELKQRSEHAGAVTVRLLDGSAALVTEKLNQIPSGREVCRAGRVAGDRSGVSEERMANAGNWPAPSAKSPRRNDGKSRNCTPKRAAWTKCSATSRGLRRSKRISR